MRCSTVRLLRLADFQAVFVLVHLLENYFYPFSCYIWCTRSILYNDENPMYNYENGNCIVIPIQRKSRGEKIVVRFDEQAQQQRQLKEK